MQRAVMTLHSIIGVLLFAAIFGCSKSEPEIIVNGPLVTIELPKGGSIQTSLTDFTGNVDGYKINVRAGQLTVNGKDYGSVKAGDRAKIEDSGKVTVNGEERIPQ